MRASFFGLTGRFQAREGGEAMMKTLATRWSLTGIVLAGVLLSLAGQAFSDDWDPIEDANDDFVGNPCFGANLAVAETRFLPKGSMGAEPTLLIVTHPPKTGPGAMLETT
jgi:hypothetical protein